MGVEANHQLAAIRLQVLCNEVARLMGKPWCVKHFDTEQTLTLWHPDGYGFKCFFEIDGSHGREYLLSDDLCIQFDIQCVRRKGLRLTGYETILVGNIPEFNFHTDTAETIVEELAPRAEQIARLFPLLKKRKEEANANLPRIKAASEQLADDLEMNFEIEHEQKFVVISRQIKIIVSPQCNQDHTGRLHIEANNLTHEQLLTFIELLKEGSEFLSDL